MGPSSLSPIDSPLFMSVYCFIIIYDNYLFYTVGYGDISINAFPILPPPTIVTTLYHIF